MIEAKVRGIPDYKAALLDIVPKLRKRALLNALRKAARVVQKEARARTPVLAHATPYRNPGTVRKAISVRLSKVAKQQGNVGVFVNVRPLPGTQYKTIKTSTGGKRRVISRQSQRSAKNPNDPFYWRFINFGTNKFRGIGFLESGARKLGDALTVFINDLGPQIAKLNQNPKDPL